ncbi:glycerophosphoryl diester phosphodiesterase membrane domain-containing protein [Enterococcus faecium]|nr:glycerophosphoryl diester phosphodiesterase membrane domain-containing protein [Enterococcus faecium]
MILPISGLSFNSDLLSKIKIPAFIMDFIFANRWIVVSSFLLVYIFLGYIGIRLIFALPEMILRDRPFRASIRESWLLTKSRLFAIMGQFIVIGGTILLLSSLGYIVVILAQSVVEEFFPNYALISAVFAMTLLQGILLFNIVMSTVGIFISSLISWMTKVSYQRFPSGLRRKHPTCVYLR